MILNYLKVLVRSLFRQKIISLINILGLAIAFVWPVAYFSMKKWLELFAHRIDIGSLPSLGASLIVLVISWLITATLAQRTANMNPVLSLRREFSQ